MGDDRDSGWPPPPVEVSPQRRTGLRLVLLLVLLVVLGGTIATAVLAFSGAGFRVFVDFLLSNSPWS